MIKKMIFGLVLGVLFAVPTFALSNALKLEFSNAYGNVFLRWDDEWEILGDALLPKREDFSSAKEYYEHLQYLIEYYNMMVMRMVKYVDLYLRSGRYTDAGYDELSIIQIKLCDRISDMQNLSVEASRESNGLDYCYLWME